MKFEKVWPIKEILCLPVSMAQPRSGRIRTEKIGFNKEPNRSPDFGAPENQDLSAWVLLISLSS